MTYDLISLDSLESKISELEAENQELRSRRIAVPALVESIQPPIVKVHLNTSTNK